LKAIDSERLTYEHFYNSLKLVGGTAIHVERQDVLSNPNKSYTGTKRTENNNKRLFSPPEI